MAMACGVRYAEAVRAMSPSPREALSGTSGGFGFIWSSSSPMERWGVMYLAVGRSGSAPGIVAAVSPGPGTPRSRTGRLCGIPG
jgi:hypothetical protein